MPQDSSRHAQVHLRTRSTTKYGGYNLRPRHLKQARQVAHPQMSYCTTPRKSPRKVSQGVPSPAHYPDPPSNQKWEREHELQLLEILKKFQQQGVRPPYGSFLIPRITHKLNKRLSDGSSYVGCQVSRKISYFKDLHKDYTDLINQQHGTGYGWDDNIGMVVLSADQWDHFRATPGLYKYYKFRSGPPANWDKLCVIFDGTTATGNLRYASTQSPPRVDRHFIPPAIVDLTEPHPSPSLVSQRKRKEKRHASPLESSRSSKRSSLGVEIFEMVTDKLTFLQNSYEKKCNLNDGGNSHADATSKAGPLAQSPSEDCMDLINALSKEISLPLNAYLRACDVIMESENKAKIVLKMNDIAQRQWLLNFVKPGDV